jgi:trehalose/maltose hydrolase-like predicted phosphorylase
MFSAVAFEEQLQPLDPKAISALTAAQLRVPNPKWLLVEEGFTLSREHEIESLFAIANGYVGNRGSLAEGSPLSAPATFVAGIFRELATPGAVPELMILPDWTAVRISIDGQPLNIERGEILEHRRILDMRRGMFWREWCHRDPHGRITRISAFRLASLSDRHLLLHSITLRAENYSSLIEFESSMEVPDGTLSVLAPDWKVRSNSARPNILPLGVRIPGRDTTVAFGVTSQMLSHTEVPGKRLVAIDERRITEQCEIEVEVGSECQLDRRISIFSSRETPAPFECAMRHLKGVMPQGMSAAVLAHVREWESRCDMADVDIEGDEFLRQALRFASYHLISSANPQDGHVSIGARGLTGAAYKGHVFWDTEIYMLPFFVFTCPEAARRLLEYRYHTLDGARQKALAYGFRGAMYPWEAADTGAEVTPRMVIAPNGEVLNIRNGDMEIHITAAVAFAIWQYWHATGDDDFFLQFGAEILLECARFWASRLTTDRDGICHIEHVIGPDEYHENVDDNAYTNLMAAWNLRRGAETASLVEHRWPDRWLELSGQMHLTRKEVLTWPKLADGMFTGFDPRTRIFEQFRGYFAKEHVDLTRYEPRTAAMDVILGHERIQHTDIVKQADVVLAAYLLEDEISADVRVANFHYYEPRTGHGSSLSPSIHALVAARLGETRLAQNYLRQASDIDLGNNMGNAAGGVHAAALGGLWQAMVFGFGGFRSLADGVSFAPNLLPHWNRLSFPLQWRGSRLRVDIEQNVIRVAVESPQPIRLSVEGGPAVDAQTGLYTTELAAGGWGSWHQRAR